MIIRSVHLLLGLDLQIGGSLVSVRRGRHYLKVVSVGSRIFAFLNQIAVPQPCDHGCNLPCEQIGDRYEHYQNREDDEGKVVVGKCLNLVRFIALKRHLLPIVDEAIVLMLIID